MVYLYLISIILSIVCILSLYLGVKSLNLSFHWKEIVHALRDAPKTPFQKSSLLLFTFLGTIIVLPFFWILSIYLKTDANVLSVLVSMFWGYHLLKYLYPEKKESNENK
ncbi:MAG: hypothetical protein QXO70_03810 [Candidatus Pacearchaeota archaeon]